MENYRVTALTLNVRNAASIDAAVINALHQGDVVEVVDKSADAYWFKVKKDAVDGWASHKYLELVTAQSFDYSSLPFLNNLTADKKLTDEESANFYYHGIVPLCDDKPQFQKAINEGYVEVPDAQVAPCATTTSAVLEHAFRLVGMPAQENIFNVHSNFQPTHNVERMLYRLGFNYWLKSRFKSQKGAIGLLAGRYTFHGTPKHSGHIYTIFSEIDAKYDLIGDNTGYNHKYQGKGWESGTEGFWLPSGIIPQNR